METEINIKKKTDDMIKHLSRYTGFFEYLEIRKTIIIGQNTCKNINEYSLFRKIEGKNMRTSKIPIKVEILYISLSAPYPMTKFLIVITISQP